jgi:hypothetical protein
MRSRHVLVIVALLTMTLAAPAKADPPDVLLPPQPISYAFVTDTCGFDVLIEGGGKQGLIFFADHVRLIAPGQWATFTNLETGESMTISNSGPGKYTFSENEHGGVTVTLTGTGNWGHDHGDELILTSGLFVATFVFDADWNLVSFDEDNSRARVVDLCAALS